MHRLRGGHDQLRLAGLVAKVHPVLGGARDAMGGGEHHVLRQHHGAADAAVRAQHHHARAGEGTVVLSAADDGLRPRRAEGEGIGKRETERDQTFHDFEGFLFKMIPIFIGGPAVEPVTLAEMNAYLRVDEDDGTQDELIAGLVRAARLTVEAASRRILIEQQWRVVLDSWPAGGTVLLPLSPLIAVERIAVTDAAGTAVDLPSDAFEADLMSDPPRIVVLDPVQPGRTRNGISIDLRAGYGATAEAVPATLRLAIRILVAHWFENRGDVAGEQILPPEALALSRRFNGRGCSEVSLRCHSGAAQSGARDP